VVIGKSAVHARSTDSERHDNYWVTSDDISVRQNVHNLQDVLGRLTRESQEQLRCVDGSWGPLHWQSVALFLFLI
jgi:hypothetical protein